MKCKLACNTSSLSPWRPQVPAKTSKRGSVTATLYCGRLRQITLSNGHRLKTTGVKNPSPAQGPSLRVCLRRVPSHSKVRVSREGHCSLVCHSETKAALCSCNDAFETAAQDLRGFAFSAALRGRLVSEAREEASRRLHGGRQSLRLPPRLLPRA